MTRTVATFCLMLLAVTAFGTKPEDIAAIAATVDAFHDALRRGDARAVTELLASDALILENGFAQTRAEYERHHLQEDIEFARAVPSVRSISNTQIEGEAAWIVSTSRTKGTFHERKIDTEGVELMVLSRFPQGWRIRAIHWSSHDAKKAK